MKAILTGPDRSHFHLRCLNYLVSICFLVQYFRNVFCCQAMGLKKVFGGAQVMRKLVVSYTVDGGFKLF